MPWGLKRFHETGNLHFITFSCYHRLPLLGDPEARDLFERALEQARRRWGLFVTGYVIMPEHVHLLMSEPEHGQLSQAIQGLKQSVGRRLAQRATEHFWQERYYDFNVWSERKRIEKLRYIVEIESQWTARRREARHVADEDRNSPAQATEA